MNKTKHIALIRLGAAAVMTAMTASTALAGTWQSGAAGWRYHSDGGQPVGGWIQDGAEYYHTDENGYMQTGWYQDMADNGRWYYLNPQQGGPQGALKTGWLLDNGRWYFLDTRIGGPRGSLMSGWQWIDGKCYYLDPAQGGAMAADCITPDGSRVDASGAWVDGNGVPHYEEGKGISSTVTVDITAQGPGGAVTGSGGRTAGGSGGGSGSGSGSGSSYSGIYGEDFEWSDYSDDSVSRSANDFENGNYGMMDSDEREEMKEAIADFKDTYITSGMSDFEKEIMIIKWLVENCSYEKAKDWSRATGYSCIVEGKAQCSGYADAFLQTAKACGLEVRYVYSSTHAWNLIKLDGEWYHVDVTWEDPVGRNDYGFSGLRNLYINLEDDEIKGVSHHHSWQPDRIKARGSAYGRKVVAQYLKDGTIDTSKGESFKEQMDRYFDKVTNEDGSNSFIYTSTVATADRICAYLETMIEAKSENFGFLVRYPSAYTAQVTGNYSKLVKINNEIEEMVNSRINEKYQNVLKNPVRISLFLKRDADVNYYAYENGSLYYQEGQGRKINYLVRFVDTDGNEVGTQSGTGEKKRSVQLTFPEGYSWISNGSENCKVSQGKVSYGGRSFQILDGDEIEVQIRLRKLKTENSKPVEQEKEVPETGKEAESAGNIAESKEENKTENQRPEKASPSSADRR